MEPPCLFRLPPRGEARLESIRCLSELFLRDWEAFWDWLPLAPSDSRAMFLKVIVHFMSSPAKTVWSRQWTKARMLPLPSGAMMAMADWPCDRGGRGSRRQGNWFRQTCLLGRPCGEGWLDGYDTVVNPMRHLWNEQFEMLRVAWQPEVDAERDGAPGRLT